MTRFNRYQPKTVKHGDRDTCTCPHCWTVFPLEDALYVCRHPDLVGDPVLGMDAASRFKPTRFTPAGQAIDPGGHPCLEMACPNCHLEVPRSLTDYPTLFLSIIGTPSSGKSFFLTTMIWELRRALAAQFLMALTDLETNLNAILHDYEETLFFPKDPDKFVSLAKTQQHGDLYNRVLLNNAEVLLPRPFLFTLRPMADHPESARARQLSRSLVLYDNAGEHFNPSQDSFREPGTMHMSRSEVLFFLFDPTQDARFRAQLSGHRDPQCQRDFRVQRQDVVFNEAARRIRRHVGIADGSKHQKLVVVVVHKYDIWKRMLKVEPPPEPFVCERTRNVHGLDMHAVEDVSLSLRQLLKRFCPELVASVEEFAERVVYIPVSSLGHSPTLNKDTHALEVRPRDISPFWASIPFLYAFSRQGLIYKGTAPPKQAAESAVITARRQHTLICHLANGQVLEIPDRYAGRVIHHPDHGFLLRVPPVTS